MAKESRSRIYSGVGFRAEGLGEVRQVVFTHEASLHRIAFVRTVIEGLDADNKAVKQEYEHFFNNYNYPFKLGIPEMGWMKGK